MLRSFGLTSVDLSYSLDGCTVCPLELLSARHIASPRVTHYLVYGFELIRPIAKEIDYFIPDPARYAARRHAPPYGAARRRTAPHPMRKWRRVEPYRTVSCRAGSGVKEP